jgi:hypothetical protein
MEDRIKYIHTITHLKPHIQFVDSMFEEITMQWLKF